MATVWDKLTFKAEIRKILAENPPERGTWRDAFKVGRLIAAAVRKETRRRNAAAKSK